MSAVTMMKIALLTLQTCICEYYQLPQIREDSFDPTLVFSGDLEFEQQADACEDNTTAGLPTGTVAVVTSAVGISVAALIATAKNVHSCTDRLDTCFNLEVGGVLTVAVMWV